MNTSGNVHWTELNCYGMEFGYEMPPRGNGGCHLLDKRVGLYDEIRYVLHGLHMAWCYAVFSMER